MVKSELRVRSVKECCRYSAGIEFMFHVIQFSKQTDNGPLLI